MLGSYPATARHWRNVVISAAPSRRHLWQTVRYCHTCTLVITVYTLPHYQSHFTQPASATLTLSPSLPPVIHPAKVANKRTVIATHSYTIIAILVTVKRHHPHYHSALHNQLPQHHTTAIVNFNLLPHHHTMDIATPPHHQPPLHTTATPIHDWIQMGLSGRLHHSHLTARDSSRASQPRTHPPHAATLPHCHPLNQAKQDPPTAM